MTPPRPRPVQDRIYRALDKAPEGLTYAEIMAHCNISHVATTTLILKMKHMGLVRRNPGPTHYKNPARWYIAGREPAEQVIQPLTTIRKARLVAMPGPGIVPAGLRVQYGPSADPGARYRATTAPPVVNSSECRPWAAAAAA